MRACYARKLCPYRNRGAILKLKPSQIIGFGAIVVFGGILAMQLTQPSEKQRMEKLLATLPPVSVPPSAFELPPLDLTVPERPDFNLPSATATPAEPEATIDYAARGSQEARDDLYCASLLEAHFPILLEGKDGVNEAGVNLEHSLRLTGAGVAKLRTEGLAEDIDWVAYANAHDALALADYTANTPRIPLATCEARGAALPADTPKLP